MNKYRVKFSKLGNIRFLGHLDLLKNFQRAIKRAKLPISYSEGFNPHQKISFAIPLPLGMESICEYLDIILIENISETEILERLNKEMPIGIEILSVTKLEDNEKACASIICMGEYEVKLDINLEIKKLSEIIENIIKSEELTIEKVTKKRGREVLKNVNIRNEIENITVIDENTIKFKIATGSAKNLKPDVLIEYIYKTMGIEYSKFKIQVKRTSLLKEIEGKFIELDK